MSDDLTPIPPDAALMPIQQQRVQFYGDEIIGVLIERDGRPPEWYVPLRPISQFLGLSWPAQYRRTQGDTVLGPALLSVAIIATESPTQGRGHRDLLCLPLRYLPGWLFGINAGKVKPALADKITLYRRDCFDALWQAFQADILPPPTPPAQPLTGADMALEIATAVYHLAHQQRDLEARVDQVTGQQATMAEYMRGFIGDTRHRLTALEVQLSGGATISEAQAAEVALAVKNVGQRLFSSGDKGGYGRVYGELYRRYGIGAYRNLPAARYTEALDWLQAWYRELADPSQENTP